MQEEKYAFESSECVSIAMFLGSSGFGDFLVSKKIFNAFVELEPRCSIDIFTGGWRKIASKGIFGESKNLNLILDRDLLVRDLEQKYDMVLRPQGTFLIFAGTADKERLKAKSPALYDSLTKINAYNEKFVKPFAASYNSSALHHLEMARVLGKDIWYFLSCDGAIPIRDDDTPYIFLSPEFKSQFDDLKLGKYITIYSNIGDIKNSKIKTWPIEYLVEYVRLVKERLPQIEVIQVGEGWDAKVENADRHYMGLDLELTKYIIGNSLLHVGCEGGLIHLATALGTKCLTIFSFTNAYYHGYKQNINLVPKLCNPCVYIFDHGASKSCPRGYDEPPCRRAIKPQQVFEATCNYLHQIDGKLEYCIPYLQKNIKIPCDYLNQLV